MKIATWNVNSLKVRLQHVQSWLMESQADVLCLQETKTEDANFPLAELQQAGYQVVFCGQKTYNGVAIISKHAMTDVQYGLPNFEDAQKRVIAATVNDVRVICVYIPNGESVDSDKYQYKLAWLAALQAWLKDEMQRYPKLALLGDYNIAPEDRDVHDPVAWAGKVLCSEPERAAFRAMQQLGLRDAFRLFEQPEKTYSWWDYRMMGFRRNHGLRIDHILLSAAVTCTACSIDKAPRKLERPSDHTPVWAEIA
ncbi:MAG: exodeoxyribonuclease III [Gallionellales bacterium 35-53-114]|jgi:exodeoxyribonuclease-3|nr:MAG: exodeoxyribonuclease III [Gallionellales bacterium 35-53-114]OYZ63496.1 MAG: exodeoxyribonuclease III [Gallionellales bacterium 24-53-125]OZB10892.1 MAG: exodeoxyribonuclease III [Gallionellales bacterium 39-52-133]HQS58928.1 exodeoxyribonuclease III [Gallionellaceae bacterium]HQS75687.1 exodeoxyribonuclease III [Gallionellaceae bacterium]